VVDADQDVAVVVARYQATPYVSAAYTGITNPASTVRLPLVHRNNGGWYSDIMIMNTGSSATGGTVYFQPGCSYPFSTLQPNGSVLVSTNGITCVGTAVGARVTSGGGQPLAVVTMQRKYSGSVIVSAMDYEGFPSAFNPNYLPLLMRGNSGWDAGLMLQNPNGIANTINIDFYNQAPGGWCCSGSYNVGADSVLAIFPLPVPSYFVGSGRANSTSGLLFMSIVNQIKSGSNYNAMSFSAVSGGTNAAAVPLVLNDYDDWLGRNDWVTGISVQNLGASAASVTVSYYGSNGALAGTSSLSVPTYSTGIFYPPATPTNFFGSAWVSANQPIAVAVNHITYPAGTDDTSMSHGGINR
jgi:hypothetical protein